MKISVITLHTVVNYGSILQTYATQKILENLGHEVEVVDYWRKSNVLEATIQYKISNNKIFAKYYNSNIITKKVIYYFVKFLCLKRRKHMDEFMKNINLSKVRYHSYEELLKNTPQADIYLTGSDQVWNSEYNEGIEKPMFLEYAPEDKKRIAFSASFGKSELENWEKEQTRELLNKYSYISMRENTGVKIINDLGLEATHVLDPTLMLDLSQWSKIARPFNNKKPYILIYQLNKNEKMDKYTHALAENNNWNVIRIISGISQKKAKEKCILNLSVEKFIGCFLSAECVITDSFHATAFSLNLNREFISIIPEKFGTRIESVLELTGTENRILKSYSDFSILKDRINFKKVNDVLDVERKKGLGFLKKAINE